MTTIIEEVLQQCDRNDAQWGGHEHDDAHTDIQWIEHIDHQFYCLEEPDGMLQFRERMIKVASLAIQAVESYDRKNNARTISG